MTTDRDPTMMQPHELEAELGLTAGSSGPHEWKWMRQLVGMHRRMDDYIIRLERLEAVNKRQLDYYRAQPTETKK